MRQFHEAMLNAFPMRQELEKMVMFHLNKNLDDIVAPGNLSDSVFKLIKWADSTGNTNALIKGALEYNPGNEKLREFADLHPHPETDIPKAEAEAKRLIRQIQAQFQRVKDYLVRYEGGNSTLRYAGVVSPLHGVMLRGVNTMSGPPLFVEFDKETAETLMVRLEMLGEPFDKPAKRLTAISRELNTLGPASENEATTPLKANIKRAHELLEEAESLCSSHLA